MITVKGRELMIPPMEREIGTTYDESAEVRIFRIDRVTAGGIDLSHLNYRLDLEYQGEQKDTSLLDIEVREDSILLTWTIPHSCLTTAGTVWIAIRGYDDNGTVKWASNKGSVYVEDTIDTPGSNPPGLTELEQLERRIDEKTDTLDANEGERQQNEVIRQENEQRRQNNEAEWQRQAEAAIGQANTTLQGANAAMEAAQGSEASAAESAAAANASKEAAAGSASAAEESAAEAQRISQGFAGFDGTAQSVPAVDVQGLVVTAGGNSNVQALINAVADQVINRLIKITDIVNNGLCTEPGKYPLDAAYGKTLRDYIGRLQDSVATINSDLAVQSITNIDILTLGTGRYYATNCTNMPPGWLGAYLDVERLDSQWCRITAWPPYKGLDIPYITKQSEGAWQGWTKLIVGSEVNVFNASCIDLFFDAVNNWPVIKWHINADLQYQMVLTQNGISVDRFDGTQWINMYQLTK